MRPENKKMKEYLKQHGISALVKYIKKGSLKGCWQLYNPDLRWTEEFMEKLEDIGFRDFDGQHLGKYSGNGGMFSVCLRI